MSKRFAKELHPSRYRWIVDGHNMIFAVEEWESLQLDGEKRAARRQLEDSLEAFGRAIGGQISRWTGRRVGRWTGR